MELDAHLSELSTVVDRLELGPESSFTATDLRLLESTASTLITTNVDADALDAYAGLLDRASQALVRRSSDELNRAAVLTGVRLVRLLVRHLQLTPVPSTPSEADGGLGNLLRSRKHAPDVFRQIALGSERPTQIEHALKLRSEQVHRVLRWGVIAGLLSRTGAEKDVAYRLTRLGEVALEAFDEPAWLRLASVVTRVAIRGRSLRSTTEEMASEVVELTALPSQQAKVSVGSMLHTLTSPLVTPLGEALSESTGTRGKLVLCPVIYPKELEDETEHLLKRREPRPNESLWVRNEGFYAPRLDAQAESLVRFALYRTGFADRIEELPPQHFSDPQEKPWVLSLDKPIISLSSPMVSPVTLALLFEYGIPLYFDENVSSQIYWDRGLEGTPYLLTQELDCGMLVRIWDDMRGLTHFVLAGLKPSGTYAACNYFSTNIDRLLEEFPRKSFAVVLRAKRGYYDVKLVDPEIVQGPEEIRVTVPRKEFERLDIRYLDALPTVAKAYLEDRTDVEKLLTELAEAGVDDHILEILTRLKDEMLTQYVRARYFAAVFQYLGVFEEMLIMLLARLASGKDTEWHRRLQRNVADEKLAEVLLRKELNIATYTTNAMLDLVKRRDRLKDFVDAALRNKEALERLEKDCRTTVNAEGLRHVYPELLAPA